MDLQHTLNVAADQATVDARIRQLLSANQADLNPYLGNHGPDKAAMLRIYVSAVTTDQCAFCNRTGHTY